MTQEIILNADSRERSGSNKARVIRKIDGMIPAVIYGNNIPGENIKLPLNELTKASAVSYTHLTLPTSDLV